MPWRSEHLLAGYQLKQATQRIQLNALAALVAVFGLVMLNIAAFFAIVPYWGHALAALTVSGADRLASFTLVATIAFILLVLLVVDAMITALGMFVVKWTGEASSSITRTTFCSVIGR